MFIRWKQRRGRQPDVVRLEAVLVESIRRHGMPRQRRVRSLGSIRVPDCGTAAAAAFWQCVTKRLTALALPPETHQALEAHLARIVPRPIVLAPEALTCPATDGDTEKVARPRGMTPLGPGLALRWRRRQVRRPPDEAWDALLIWRGPPLRATYLASLRARYHTAPAHRAWFWSRVDARLILLALEETAREALEAALAQSIPRPTPDDLANVAAQRATLAQWARQSMV